MGPLCALVGSLWALVGPPWALVGAPGALGGPWFGHEVALRWPSLPMFSRGDLVRVFFPLLRSLAVERRCWCADRQGRDLVHNGVMPAGGAPLLRSGQISFSILI